MITASECPAARMINFYVNEASAECIEGRRGYLENYLLPRLREGIITMQAWKEKSADDIELIGIYQKGVEFLTDALKQAVQHD